MAESYRTATDVEEVGRPSGLWDCCGHLPRVSSAGADFTLGYYRLLPPGADALACGGPIARVARAVDRMKLGLIAGNGRFPFLLLDAARAQGLDVVVAAIREETDAEMDQRAATDQGISVYWLSLGELSRLIETFQKEGVEKAVMAGQVKHKQIFSSIRPDWRLAKLLLNLRTRSTDALLGAVAKVLGDEGIELISSTAVSGAAAGRRRAC